MIRERFPNGSAPIPALAYARGSGSRELGNREQVVGDISKTKRLGDSRRARAIWTWS